MVCLLRVSRVFPGCGVPGDSHSLHQRNRSEKCQTDKRGNPNRREHQVGTERILLEEHENSQTGLSTNVFSENGSDYRVGYADTET